MASSIYVVIPVHNRVQHTLRCLASLSEQEGVDLRIVVVDAGSSDGTGSLVAEYFPQVVIVRTDLDSWWAATTNLGVQYALDHGGEGDFVLTLNNDVEVPQNYVQTIVHSAQQQPQSLIGSVSVRSDDPSLIYDGGVLINWWTAKYTPLNKGSNLAQTLASLPCTLVPTHLLPGRGTLIPIEVFHQIGLFDEKRLPHYGADFEFSSRARRNGYCLLVDYNAAVVSDVTSTGLNNEVGLLSWLQLVRSFFSIRSPYNVRYRWEFARLSCPRVLFPIFFTLDIGRLAVGVLRNQVKALLLRNALRVKKAE